MALLKKIGSFIYYDTFGAIAIANFLVCALSGVFLAIPFDVENPYESISNFMLTSPGATFFRNIHYWSAQFFLVFTIIHLWEHFYKSTEDKVNNGVWIRLIISLVAVFYVMLSGFLLKADADSLQARLIIDSLLTRIPWIGEFLAWSLLGSSESFQVIYVHHIATASIFLFIIIHEHARYIWTKISTFVITAFLLIIISLVFHAPLHDNLDMVIKGPWYFLGLQEILHWFRRPEYILLIIIILFIILYIIPKLNQKQAWVTKWAMFVIFVFYMGLTVVGYFFRGENWILSASTAQVHQPFDPDIITPSDYFDVNKEVIPTVFGRKESCLVCHDNIKGFTASHNPEAIGCISCHGGNAFSPDKSEAHEGMVLIPGNLADAKRSCGTTNCHPDITERIHKTMMSTMSGVVSVDRFVFNEIHTPSQLSHISEIGHSPADEHLRDLCASCHLGNPKTELGPIDQLSRGGGCNACHLNYSREALDEMKAMFSEPRPDSIEFMFHPELSLNITKDHCFGCHSRSGRISTNYEGWHETQLKVEDIEDYDGYRVLQDQRVFRFVKEDIHHKKGMDCIDCHNSHELMGDGNLYMHEEQQVKIRCEDCHFNHKVETMKLEDFDRESSLIAGLKGIMDKEQNFLKIGKSGFPLINTYRDHEEKSWLVTNNTHDTLPLIGPAGICTRGEGHESLTCRSCHTSWAPQCIGCHNEFDKRSEGYDLLENTFKTGEWVEFVGEYLADAPVLGVSEVETDSGIIKETGTFVAGMVLSIDKSIFSDKYKEEEIIFHRLFAPTSAHTTTTQGRSCKSCHNNPNALGYGRGVLEYKTGDGKGTWTFKPRFANNKHDDLPEDAWIGFLSERTGKVSTRENARPFSLEEQKRILTVGACLTCHEEDSEVMMRGLDDFDASLKQVSEKCILPVW